LGTQGQNLHSSSLCDVNLTVHRTNPAFHRISAAWGAMRSYSRKTEQLDECMKPHFDLTNAALMKPWRYLVILVVLGFAAPSFAADLSVRIQNILSNEGKLRLALYSKDEYFPVLDDYQNPPAGVQAILVDPKPVNGEQVVVFKGLPPGRYAVAVHHNISGSGRNKRKPITGMPIEPYGFTNNRWSLFSSPRFSDAAIEVGDKDVEHAIWVSTHLSKVGGSTGNK